MNEHNGGVGPQGVKALEVLLADIENRLRGTILRIIRPSLQQASDMSARLEVVAVKVEQHENILGTTEKVEKELSKQAEVLVIVKEQMNLRDNQAILFERQTLNTMAELHTHNEEVERKLKEHANDIHQAQRESSRIWEDVERMQKDDELVVKGIWKGVNDGFKKSDHIRDEAAAAVTEVQKLHNALTEELFGEHKGLTKLREDLTQLTQFVDPLPQIQADVNSISETQSRLETRQENCEDFCKQSQKSYEAFTAHTELKLSDTNDEFKEGVNQLIAHHATMMQGIRREYSEELKAAQNTNRDVINFESMLRKYCTELADDLVSQSNRLDSIHKNLTQELEEVKSRRKKERQAYEAHVQETKHDMRIQQEVVGSFNGSLGYLSRIVGLVLESERVTSALHVQDYVDRSGERWLGRPEDLDHHAQQPHTAEMLEKVPRRYPGDIDRISGNPSMHQLVSVDPQRGFAKMAYVPGRVAYGGLHYDRQDMLLLQNKLLQKAYAAFEKGPNKDASLRFLKEYAHHAGQPSAVGGTGGSHGSSVRMLKKTFGDGLGTNDFSEDPRSTAASTGTQFHSSAAVYGKRPGCKEGRPGSKDQGHRPGSTGQPQGTGSRGTMFGALGETEPPLDADHPESHGQPGARGSGAGRSSMGSGTVRLPVIESIGSSTAREYHPTSEAAERSPRRLLTAR